MNEQLLTRLWPWLPTFRVIAETEHLGRAAAQLHVVPSAVSRTLALLEETLGAQVFDRVGRRIRLNERGRGLLMATHHATEALERAVSTPTPQAPFQGLLRLGTLGVLTNEVVLPVVLELCREHPNLAPALRTVRASEANHLLAARELELACVYDPTSLEGIVSTELGPLPNAIFCGRGHPLFGRRVSLARVLEHPFSAPMSGDHGTPMDNWPLHLSRRVGMRISLLSTNLEVAVSGTFVTVLPEIVARPEVAKGRLWCLERHTVPPTIAFVMCRDDDRQRAEVLTLTNALRARVRALSPGGRAGRPRT